MIVQAIPHVVGSLPPVEEFTRPVYNHVHQEQFAAVPVIGHVSPVLGVAARRPPPLVEVRPSVRAQRHVVEQLADIAPMVQILDSPEPQMVVQLLEVFRLLDTQLPDEQAVSVPKISCSRVLPVLEFLSRSQRISWWKCRLRSRSLTLQCTYPSLPSGSSFVTKPRQGPISGTDALARRCGSRRRASESSGSARRGLERRSGAGTKVLVPVRMTSLLCLLSEELHRPSYLAVTCSLFSLV